MTIARILEQERKTTQSGKANAGKWILEFERQQPLRPDPLTGWNGSGDTNPQVRIAFATREAAIAYCDRHELAYHIVPAAPVRLEDPGLRRQFPLKKRPKRAARTVRESAGSRARPQSGSPIVAASASCATSDCAAVMSGPVLISEL